MYKNMDAFRRPHSHGQKERHSYESFPQSTKISSHENK